MSGNFVGEYVRDMLLVLTASAASGGHVVIVAPPGMGKTAVERLAAKKIYGYLSKFFRFDPSTQPEIVKGAYDPKILTSTGDFVIKTDGTAYDPTFKNFIFDEVSRPMDAIFDICIDVLDRQDVDPNDAPVVWATANFLPQNERTDAMRDRFWYTQWWERQPLDPKAVAAAQMAAIGSGMEIGNGLPTLADIDAVRKAVPGPQAVEAVCDLIAVLCDEAAKYSENDGYAFEPNPRRIAQWSKHLFAMTVLRTGDPNFTACHPDAIACLRWMWPVKDEKEAAAWAEVCSALVDPMQTAIDNLFQTAHQKMRDVQGTKTEKAQKLGIVLNDGKQSLYELARGRGLLDSTGQPTDPRINDAITQLTIAMSDILSGG